MYEETILSHALQTQPKPGMSKQEKEHQSLCLGKSLVGNFQVRPSKCLFVTMFANTEYLCIHHYKNKHFMQLMLKREYFSKSHAGNRKETSNSAPIQGLSPHLRNVGKICVLLKKKTKKDGRLCGVNINCPRPYEPSRWLSLFFYEGTEKG